MADTTIEVPGTDSVTIAVGDMLTINFVQTCCFCCNPEQVDSFSPQLPLGDHMAKDRWSGKAQESGTFQFGHVSYGAQCGALTGPITSSGRTIIVGG
jgi:hypothetical protein